MNRSGRAAAHASSDYLTYTAKERRWLQRNVMFYGFLRHKGDKLKGVDVSRANPRRPNGRSWAPDAGSTAMTAVHSGG